MKNGSLPIPLGPLAIVAAVLPTSADAHHAMGNAIPSNALEGLISGLAHPVIGLDHLLFVIAIGVGCYWYGRRSVTALGFIAGTLGGTILHVYQPALPYPDVWVALTLALLALMFFWGRRFLQSRAALAFFMLSGIAHGYAYGEAIVGAEPTPLFAYLVGFAVVQLAIVLGAYKLVRAMDQRQLASRAAPALGGLLLIAGAGFLFLALT